MVSFFSAILQYKFRSIISIKKMAKKFGNFDLMLIILNSKGLHLYSHFFSFSSHHFFHFPTNQVIKKTHKFLHQFQQDLQTVVNSRI